MSRPAAMTRLSALVTVAHACRPDGLLVASRRESGLRWPRHVCGACVYVRGCQRGPVGRGCWLAVAVFQVVGPQDPESPRPSCPHL